MTYPETKSRVLQTSRLAGNPTSCSRDKAAGLPRSSVRQRQQQRHQPNDVRESPGRLQHAAHVSPTKGIHTLRRAPDMSLSTPAEEKVLERRGLSSPSRGSALILSQSSSAPLGPPAVSSPGLVRRLSAWRASRLGVSSAGARALSLSRSASALLRCTGKCQRGGGG